MGAGACCPRLVFERLCIVLNAIHCCYRLVRSSTGYFERVVFVEYGLCVQIILKLSSIRVNLGLLGGYFPHV